MSADGNPCFVNEPIEMKKCKICKKEQQFDFEGNSIKDKWFCCWTCVRKAIEKGIIDKTDIKVLSRKRSF